MSRDPLALDTVAVAMLGLKAKDVPILVSARERQLGCSDLKEIEILGDYDSPPRLANFKLPILRSARRRNQWIIGAVVLF